MISVLVFDFEQHREIAAQPQEIASLCTGPRYAWIDILAEEPAREKALLTSLGLNEKTIASIQDLPQEGRFDLYDGGMHLTLSETALRGDQLDASPLDVVVAEHFLVTHHRRDLELIGRMKRVSHDDFLKFSQSPGFLLYELADGLCEIYRKGLRSFSDAVESMQANLLSQSDENVFSRVSALMRNLLVFRKTVLAAREILHELGTRRSKFVSETTQPFLHIAAGTLERLGDDLTVERDVLNEALSLYMGIVGHRTNRIVRVLTILSMIFLPLTFVTGVYGMNLQIPEAHWPYMYLVFWCLVVAVGAGMVVFLRRRKWL